MNFEYDPENNYENLPKLPPGVWDDPKPEDMEAYTEFVRAWFGREQVSALAVTRAEIPTSYSADYGSGIKAYNIDLAPVIESISFSSDWPVGDTKSWWSSWAKGQLTYLIELAKTLELGSAIIQVYEENAGTPFTTNIPVDMGSGIFGDISFHKVSEESPVVVELQVNSSPWQATVALEYIWVDGTFADGDLVFEKSSAITKVNFTDSSGPTIDSFEEEFFIGPDEIVSPGHQATPTGCGCEANPVKSSAGIPESGSYPLVSVLDQERDIYTLRMKIKPGADRITTGVTSNRQRNNVLNINSIWEMTADSSSVRLWYTAYGSSDGSHIWEKAADPDVFHDFVMTRDEDDIVKIYWDGVLETSWDDSDSFVPPGSIHTYGSHLLKLYQAVPQIKDETGAAVSTYANEVKDVSLHCNAVDAETIAEWYTTGAGVDDIILVDGRYEDDCDDYDYDYDGGGDSDDLCQVWGDYDDNFNKYPYAPEVSIEDWEDDLWNVPANSHWQATGDGQIDPVANNGSSYTGLQWHEITDYTRNLWSQGYGDYVWENGLTYLRGNFEIQFGELLSSDGDSPQLVGFVLRATANPTSPFVLCCIQQLDSEPDENDRLEYQFQIREIYNNDPEDEDSSVVLDNTMSPATDLKFRWKSGDRCSVSMQDVRWKVLGSRPKLNFIQGYVSVGGGGSEHSYSGHYRCYTNINSSASRMYCGVFLSARGRESAIDAEIRSINLTYTECWGTTVMDCCGSDLDFGVTFVPPEYGPGSINPPWYDDMWAALIALHSPSVFDCDNLIDGWHLLYDSTNDYHIRVLFAVDEDGPKLRWIMSESEYVFLAEEITEFGYTYWRFELPSYLFPGTVYLSLQMDCSSVSGKAGLVVGSPGSSVIEYLAGTGGVLVDSSSSPVILTYNVTGEPEAIQISGESEVVFTFNETGQASVIVSDDTIRIVGRGKILVSSGVPSIPGESMVKTIIVPAGKVAEDLNGFLLGVNCEIEGLPDDTDFVIRDFNGNELGGYVDTFQGGFLLFHFSCDLFANQDNVFYLYFVSEVE